EDDAARDGIAFDVELRAAAALALPLRRVLLRDVEEDARRDDVIDEADFLRALSVELLSVEDDVECRGQADEARELRRAAPRREDAEVHFRQADLRFRAVGDDAPVAAERELAAAAEAGAVDRRDLRLRQFREAVQRLLAEARVLLRLFDGRGLRELGDVRAGDEDRRLA